MMASDEMYRIVSHSMPYINICMYVCRTSEPEQETRKNIKGIKQRQKRKKTKKGGGRKKHLYQLFISANMYGKITTHEVQSTARLCASVTGNLYRGSSLMRIQMDRRATEKKCPKSTKGLRIKPASKPTGPSIRPSWK